MARVILSSIVSSINGSVAGTTFQNSSYGQIMRVKPRPSGSANNAQSNIRLIQSILNSTWAALTDAQRASWQGKVGSQFKTGKQAYMNANFYLQFQGASLINTPAYNVTPPPIAPAALELNFGNLELSTSNVTDVTNFQLLVKASYPVGSTVVRSKRTMRLLYYTGALGTLQNITTHYVNALHTMPVEGQKIWFSVAYQNKLTGDLSSWSEQLLTVIVP